LLQTRTGLDVLIEDKLALALGPNIGLITNRSSVTRGGVPGIDALLAAGVRVKAAFAPEHGLRGSYGAGEQVPNAHDPETGVPVYSLYGQAKKPTPEMLGDIDLLVFDIQDVGARFYTYLYTMSYCMQAAAQHRLPIFVLDRPNPIGGNAIEGPILAPEFSSFVGMYPIPIRQGMTIGELAMVFNSEFGIGADLQVIELEGWQRRRWFDDTALPWVPPSPGIPNVETAAVYPGMCLIEGTNLSEGRGTESPFLMTGAPWVDGELLARELNDAGLVGVTFEPVVFTPTSSKHVGTRCGGVEVRVTDREAFKPVITGVKVVELARRLWPEQFAFNPPGADGRIFFDLLAGTDDVRLGIEAGRTAEELADDWDTSAFEETRRHYSIYR
jgi:uncharacterized protein YbbC (DUF1343 family)